MNIRVTRRYRKRDADGSYLFPGITLRNKVNKPQFAAQLTGEIFERLSLVIGGNRWKRLTTDSDNDLCPDLLNSGTRTYIESKAAQRSHCFKLSSMQFDLYEELVKEHAYEGENYQVVYYLWTYTALNLVKESKNVRHMIERVLASVKCLDIIHWTIIDRICREEPDTCYYREYQTWRNEKGEEYKVIQIGHRFLEKLRDAPFQAFVEDLCFDIAEWDEYVVKSPNRVVEGAEVRFEDVSFPVHSFPVYSYTRPKGFKEFPELLAKKPDDVAPF